MVSADFFKKKKISKLCLTGFILSLIALLVWGLSFVLPIARRFLLIGGWLFGAGAFFALVAIVFSIIGVKKLDRKSQKGYKFVVATRIVVGFIYIISAFALYGGIIYEKGYDIGFSQGLRWGEYESLNAHSDGYSEGYDEGYTEGYENGSNEGCLEEPMPSPEAVEHDAPDIGRPERRK